MEQTRKWIRGCALAWNMSSVFISAAFLVTCVTAVSSSADCHPGENPFAPYLHRKQAVCTPQIRDCFRFREWSCNVSDSNFGWQMKTLLSENRLVSLNIKCEQRVDAKCLNKADFLNSIKFAEVWTWIGHHDQGKVVRSESKHVGNNAVILFEKTLEGQIEVAVSCSVKQIEDQSDRRPSLNDVIADVLTEEVTRASAHPGVLCYKASVSNGSYVCGNKTIVVDSSGQPQKITLRIFAFVLLVVALFYWPYMLCSFLPTEVPEARGWIILGRASPVSLRAFLANIMGSVNPFAIFAFTVKLMTSENPDKKSILNLLIIAIAFTGTWSCLLILILYVVVHHLSLGWIFSLAIPIYIVQITLIGWFVVGKSSTDKQKCYICGQIHDAPTRDEIAVHLRMLPAVMFQRCVTIVNMYLKVPMLCAERIALRFMVLPELVPRMVILVFFYGILSIPLLGSCLVIIVSEFVLFSPKMSLILSTIRKDLSIEGGKIFASSPEVCMTERALKFLSNNLKIIKLICYGYWIVQDCLLVIPLFATLVPFFMDLSNKLPYATLGLVVTFCVFDQYRSFCKKYDHLALNLYRYWNSKLQLLVDLQMGPIPRDDCIPKDLFQNACNTLPGFSCAENIGKMVGRTVLLVVFLSIAFCYIMTRPHIDDNVKAFATLLTSLLPTISKNVFTDSRESQRLKDEILSNRVKSVVERYLETLVNDKETKHSEAENDSFIILILRITCLLLVISFAFSSTLILYYWSTLNVFGSFLEVPST